MKLLIFEDEIPAYNKLKTLIEKHMGGQEILGWGRSILEANALLDTYKEVDLIFSDIELLDGNSFEIYTSRNVEAPIIFCTAFDNYLFQAFQTNGIAYLLKPYDETTFQEALFKFQKLFGDKPSNILDEKIVAHLRSIIEGESKKYKDRFVIKKKGGIKLVAANEVSVFKATGDFTLAHIGKERHVINHSLGFIEAAVDPRLFFRINRSAMINIDYIDQIEPYFKNRLSISIKGHDEQLYTSSAKTPLFRAWLDS